MSDKQNGPAYRVLGRSGLRVAPLCLGTMMFGGVTRWRPDIPVRRGTRIPHIR